MNKCSLIPLFFLASCQMGGGTVLPSINGNAELLKLCQSAPKDILPSAPILVDGFYDQTQNGSAGMILPRFLDGFEFIDTNITQTQITEGNKLNYKDASVWGIRPLANYAGIYRHNIAQIGNKDCTKFEENLIAQGDPNSINFWNDNRFANAPRNWCIATFAPNNTAQFHYSQSTTHKTTGTSELYSQSDIIYKNNEIFARKTTIWLSQPLFPVATSSTNIGCDLKTLGVIPQLVGKNGLALRPKQAPTLLPITQ
jgi:hypothetical protein